MVPLLGSACATGAPPAAPVAPAAAPEVLPADPALVTGTLDNGLQYIVRRHQNPAGRVTIWLHVATGSLNETEETRGIAHYLEHMAFNGSTNFPPGSLIPFFQSLGLSFGRDQNAFTSFDQTVYTLALPDVRPETIDRAMLYLSDVAFRLSLQAAEVDSERQIILEEKRSRASGRQRVREEVLARLAPESTLGRRLPIGTEEAIRAMTPAQFRDYYGRWYVPSNMTVIAVGDVDPAVVVDALRRDFGTAPGGPRPEPRPAGVRPTAGRRAIVATDPELTQAEVSLTRLEPAWGPVRTVPAYRRELIERLGTWMFNRRLEAELATGQVAFLGGAAWIYDWAGAARVATTQVTASPGRWRDALADLGTVLERARQHGFSAGELDEARAALLAQAEQAAEQEPTLPARRLIQQINQAVTQGEPVMSAAERLTLERRLLPDISASEVSQSFAADFDPSNVVFALTLPASAAAPTEAELADLGRTALDVRPEPAAERVRPTRLSPAPSRVATVLDGREHAATQVWSGWLDNGVRVHHRRVEQPRNEVAVSITLAGGVIEEAAANRGITEAAVQAWNRPATSTLTSTDIRTLMTGKKTRVRGDLGADTASLVVSGDAAALEDGLGLAYLLLTDPVVEGAGFEQWRTGKLQEIAERASRPRAVLAEAEAQALYPPGEVRLRPVTAPEVERLDRDAAQAWLHGLTARAPIEVAVVGDIDRERAIALVARYLGSLPPRPRIGDTTLQNLRSVVRATGPVRVTRGVVTQTPQAQVVDGFFAPDVQNVRDSRLLILAARVLSTRMNRTIREERQLVYSIGAGVRPGEAYPGLGRFAAQAPTDPAKAPALADALDELYAAFAAAGPTAEELQVARGQMANLLDEVMRTSDFWLERLATLDYRGLALDDVARIAEDYRGFSADELRTAFARYSRPEARFRFMILPEPPR
ncbi:MAG: insulinase family protein [Candidatus Rokubacteria bacterium]|nr:insulinase family protein [Candidatus Rokubacteria bacterium]